jgi:PAS domain S-box-containing protein
MKLDTKELKNITLLYVEDDELIREQTNKILTKLFKKVFCGYDGENGLALFKEHQNEIDIIVTDINMPHLNGLQMIEQVNKLQNSIPTIVTTAHTDSNYLINAIDLNVDKYLSKPIQIKDLTVSIVDNVLKYRRANNIENLAKSLVSKSSKDDTLNNSLTNQVEQLQKQNNYYKAIIDNLVVTCKIDKNGNFVEFSDKFLRLFNYSNENIIGKNINILQCESCSQESFQKLMLRVIHAKKTIVSSYILKIANSRSIHTDLTLTPNYNSDAFIQGYTVYIDIL